jgi:DMSO/TMAO reductase YedYZ heme-binding membrane subunit
MVVTFFPLSNKYGWTYFSAHWMNLALGAIAALALAGLTALSFRHAAAKIGMAAWRRIQQWGLVVLPLIVVHYLVLGKTGKWLEWLGGKDPHPGPPGTLVGAAVVLLVLLLRGVDWAVRGTVRTADERA